jgi:hypothetical protein
MRVAVVLLVVGTLIHARIAGFGYPDLTLTFLLPLSISMGSGAFVPLAFLMGVLRDGMDPQALWLSPLLFTFAGIVGFVFREYINPDLLFPRLAYFVLFTVLYGVLALAPRGVDVLSPGFLITLVTTSLLAFGLSFWIRR